MPIDISVLIVILIAQSLDISWIAIPKKYRKEGGKDKTKLRGAGASKKSSDLDQYNDSADKLETFKMYTF